MESGGAVSYSGIDLYVTGFGKFQGVAKNPTTDLVEWLQKQCAESPHPRVELCFSDIVTVSTSQCNAALENIKKGIMKQIQKRNEMQEEQSSGTSNERKILVVNFGVNASASAFNLEKVGRNLCDFRCPDEEGVQLKDHAIDSSFGKEHCRETRINVELLSEKLGKKGHVV